MPQHGIEQQDIAAEAPPPAPAPPEPREPPRRSFLRRNPRAKWLVPAVLFLGIAAYVMWSRAQAGNESTDDAQIDAHITPVSAKVSGPVVAVHVNDNQEVKQGELLV